MREKEIIKIKQKSGENQWNQKLVLWKINQTDKKIKLTKKKKRAGEKAQITNITNERAATNTELIGH